MAINRERVEDIARNFLQQHHEVYNIKVGGFKNGIWSAEAKVSSSAGDRVRKVRVDDKTGEIISVE